MEESFFAQIRQEIADEYEKRNAKLGECLRSMEVIYDKQKEDFQKRQSSLEAENKELRKKLEVTIPGPRSRHDLHHDGDSRRVKELEAKVRELNQEVQKKEELSSYRRKRDDWAKLKLEAEVKALRKKATVGWMLGSLWDISLQGDDLGETVSMVKMLRKLQRDLERESWNVTGGSTDALDKDVQVLLDNVQSVIQKSGGTIASSKKDESSQAPASPNAERMSKIGLVMSPRSPGSPASPKSPRSRRATPTSSVSFASKDKEKEKDVSSSLANALMEIHSLCDDPEVSIGGTGKNRTDIKQMLSSIDANIRALLESEKKRSNGNNSDASGKPGSPKAVWKG